MTWDFGLPGGHHIDARRRREHGRDQAHHGDDPRRGELGQVGGRRGRVQHGLYHEEYQQSTISPGDHSFTPSVPGQRTHLAGNLARRGDHAELGRYSCGQGIHERLL